MPAFALLLLPIVLQLAVLYVLSEALNRMAYRRLGKTLYLLLMWPGVVVHELSHLVGCILTGTKVREVKLFSPRDDGGGDLVLGYVGHDRPRDAFATLVVSAAPFFGGAAALAALVSFLLPRGAAGALPPLAFGDGSAQAFAAAAIGAAKGYASFASSLLSSLDPASWRTWLFAYLFLSVSSHVAPSRPDMRYAVTAAVITVAVMAGIVVLGGRYWPGAVAAAGRWSAGAAGSVTVLLSYGLFGVLTAAALFAGGGWIADRLRSR
jgi:hypothetical protein